MMWSSLTVVLGVCAALVAGAHKTKGLCPKVKTMENFNRDNFNGTWYELGAYNRGVQGCGDCLTYTFYPTAAGYTVHIEKNAYTTGYLHLFTIEAGKSGYTGIVAYNGSAYIISKDRLGICAKHAKYEAAAHESARGLSDIEFEDYVENNQWGCRTKKPSGDEW